MYVFYMWHFSRIPEKLARFKNMDIPLLNSSIRSAFSKLTTKGMSQYIYHVKIHANCLKKKKKDLVDK